MSSNNNSSAVLKTQAKALRKAFAERGIALSHSESLETIAKIQGFKNWNTASACASHPPTPEPEEVDILSFFTDDAPSEQPTTQDLWQVPEFRSKLLADAKQYVWDNGDDGVSCPCCGLYFKKYHRPFNKGMARYLVEIVTEFEQTGDWIDVRKLPIYKSKTQRGDYGYLRKHWPFLVPAPNDDPRYKGSGFWKPNTDAVNFVHGRTTIKSHVWHIRDTVLGHDGNDIRIHEATDFDVRDLMSKGAWWVTP